MKTQNIRKTLFFIIPFLTLAALIAVLVITQASKAPDTSLQTRVVDIQSISAQVPAGFSAELSLSEGQLTVYKPDDFVILFPAGSLHDPTTASLSLRDPSVLSVAGEPNWRHLIVVNVELSDAQNKDIPDISFPVPVEVCFVLNDARLAAYLEDNDSFRVEHFNEYLSPAAWEVLPKKTYLARRLICGQSDSVSMFALSQFSSEPIPVTGPTEPYSP